MTLEHTPAVRNTLTDTVVGLIDGGPAAGKLIFTLSNGTTVVATLTFSDPAFGASVNGVAAAADITSDPSAIGNASAVAKFIIEDSTGLEVYRGTLGTAGEDINLSSLVIAAGDTVSCSSLTYASSV